MGDPYLLGLKKTVASKRAMLPRRPSPFKFCL
ncbi:hypothetical protein H206_05146 [Candidatus Electrothrix aarhusensis]|uniref:Uncharacterized protein n=1 Tax=Candidatus Electrothrix aarhusensis TaxID=1859131 RepID=A0A3S3QM50_9BACT|nr:hypothetical protein H206_05146 [Candidatus Electrothrix aarhusensis]